MAIMTQGNTPTQDYALLHNLTVRQAQAILAPLNPTHQAILNKAMGIDPNSPNATLQSLRNHNKSGTKILFHGSISKFSTFDTDAPHAYSEDSLLGSIFLTDDPRVAAQYGSTIYTVTTDQIIDVTLDANNNGYNSDTNEEIASNLLAIYFNEQGIDSIEEEGDEANEYDIEDTDAMNDLIYATDVSTLIKITNYDDSYNANLPSTIFVTRASDELNIISNTTLPTND